METEIENWIQKYDTEMGEKQVFVLSSLERISHDPLGMVHGRSQAMGLPQTGFPAPIH